MLGHFKIISLFQNNMLIKVCIEVGVVDKEFHDSYFVSLNLEKNLYYLWNKLYNDNSNQAYIGV
jgi:hypothetical protein